MAIALLGLVNAFSSLPPRAFCAALFDADQFAILGELGDEGDAEIILEVTEQFLEDADCAMEQVHSHIEADDFRGVIMKAHTLKGSFATFGLMRAHALAREIEHLAEERRGETLWSLYRDMAGCFAAGKRALLAHLNRETLVSA